MNSLRPLITITILAVVGAWLYVKINEGPSRPVQDEAQPWPGESTDGVPPLATTMAPPADATSTTAPAAAATTARTENGAAPAVAGAAPTPRVPEIPELPDAPAAESGNRAAAIGRSDAPATLPTDIPSARYPDTGAAPAPVDVGHSAVDTTGTSDPIDAGSAAARGGPDETLPVAAQAAGEHESAIATDNAMAAAGFTSPTSPSTSRGVSEPAGQYGDPPAPPEGRYGPAAGVSPQPTSLEDSQAAGAAAPGTFAESWPAIQEALDQGELARAHELLSAWYGDESLTPSEAARVDALLSQLAGSVVYSTEHQLEPAYVVKPGDTLETIARQFNVPWQLLAKINGVPSVNAVQPGQQLKVVRGPFTAVVDLRRSQLTLMLEGRYAGRFPIVVPNGTILTDGQWLVDQKLVMPSVAPAQSAYTPTASPAPVERAIVLRSESAASGQGVAAGPTLTIASSSPGIGAAGGAAIRISPQDAEELSDILSVGSRVVVRR